MLCACSGELRKREFVQVFTQRLGLKASNFASKFAPNAVTPSIAGVAVEVGSGESMEASWARRGSENAAFRAATIWGFALKAVFREIKIRKIKDPAEKSAKRAEAAVKLREGLLVLGSTFIKIGQLLSTRVDVVPQEYIKELELLQDNVPGFSGAKAKDIIEAELQQPIGEIFETFDEQAIAAASLGQVHLATLKGTGERVAVKVQREGLKELFDKDLKNLELVVKILDAVDPKSDGTDRDWVRIYEESAKLLYEEIDYLQEAGNAQRFANNFRETDWVKVPEVYMSLTTPRVITMEYVKGIKINDIEAIEKAGIDRKLMAKRIAESFLTQLCRHGFWHVDQHPGNISCDAENGGRIIYYDFGMTFQFTDDQRLGLVNLIFSFFENDTKACCDALEQVGILRPGVDRQSVEKIARNFLAEFSETVTSKAPWTSQLSKEEQQSIRVARRSKLGEDLLSVGSDVPFTFPPAFSFTFRAFVSLDGIGKGLDPAYDLTRLAQPYLRELLDVRDGSATLSLLKVFGKAVGWRPQDIASVVQSPRKVSYIEDITRRLEQGDLKLRVRTLESERAFKRLEIVQKNIANGIACSTFFNGALMLTSATSGGAPLSLAARACWALCGVFGLQLSLGIVKLKGEDKKLAKYGLR
jgi:predicted unusual protein kinase regulating ubiquinone biosynthesis (AarF/ABC1/UbiB family)